MTRKAIILTSLVLGIVSTSLVWFGDAEVVFRLTREDEIIENLSVFFYMIAFVVSLISAFRSRKVLIPLFWALLCFVCIGEETSWFQRVFNYSLPTIERMNSQNEVNLHNLNVFQSEKICSESFKLGNLLTCHYLFRFGFFGYFVIAPLLLYFRGIRSFASKINYKRPETLFIIVILAVFIFSFTATLTSPQFMRSSLCETREMLYAFFIMLNIFLNVWATDKVEAELSLS